MNANDRKKIRKSMKRTLDKERYEHTLGVAYTAMALAMRYGASLEKAELAGLLHDCAKCISNEEKLAMCRKHHITITEVERKSPFLLHAKLGSFIAMDRYGINDKEIINAILNHTTGCPDMTLLDKIIYIADYIEPRREQAPNLSEIRRLAFLDIDRALLRILEDTLEYLCATNSSVDCMTQKTYEYYKSLEKQKEEGETEYEQRTCGEHC